MNPRSLFLPVLVVLVLGLTLAGRPAAQTTEPGGPLDVLLLLPVPQPDEPTFRARSTEAITEQVSRPVLVQLARLEAEGRIQRFELLPEDHAIRVTLSGPDEIGALRALEGVIGIERTDASGLACAARGAKALQARAEAGLVPARETSSRAPETNPSIFVYYSPTSDYGYIYGYTDPNVTVSMVLKRSNGTVKATGTTTSSPTGYYSFFPAYQSCTGYLWSTNPGDIVEVTVSGTTIGMVVAPISAFADPVTDMVSGSTLPNLGLEVWSDQTSMDCTYDGGNAGGTSDGAGFFSLSIPEGFDRSVSVGVEVFDANGNSTYTYTSPPRISIGYDGGIYGYLKPNTGFTAMLLRASSTVESFGGVTDGGGWYFGDFSTQLQAGDVIQVSGGGLMLDLTYLEITNLNLDLANDLITGNAGTLAAGRTVRSNMYTADTYTCDFVYECATATVDGAGNFAINLGAVGFDLRRGDQDFSPAVYDDEGNYQEYRGTLTVPIIEVYPFDDTVQGHWYEPGMAITITLRDNGGNLKGTETDTTSTYNASFYEYFFGADIVAGDKVEVTDGARTLTMASVPNLTANLNAQADSLSGAAPSGGGLLAWVYHLYLDPVYEEYYYDRYCYPGAAVSGNYSIDLSSDLDVKAQDDARVHYTDTNGHLTGTYSHALSVNAEKEGSYVNGYTPISDLDVTIELWRSGVMQASVTTTSQTGYGYYSANLGAVVISQGDIVRVHPQGLSSYDLNIPELTVTEDAANNRVLGRAPANAPLRVNLDQPATYNDWQKVTTSNSNGDYVADFDGIFEYDCTPAEVGACTQPITTYYNNDGHGVYVRGPEPAPVNADIYEGDDTYQTATPYTARQSHTFHTTTDEDWISFAVDAKQVGLPLYLVTENLGFNARTDLFLYDIDGTTLLESETSFSPVSSEIVWVPQAAGTYYIQVKPYFSFYTVACGSTYDFAIYKARIYLPNVVRDN